MKYTVGGSTYKLSEPRQKGQMCPNDDGYFGFRLCGGSWDPTEWVHGPVAKVGKKYPGIFSRL